MVYVSINLSGLMLGEQLVSLVLRQQKRFLDLLGTIQEIPQKRLLLQQGLKTILALRVG